MTVAQCIEYLKRQDPDMPVFPLLGKDRLAPDTIGDWIQRCEMFNVAKENIPQAKINDAERVQEVMRRWQNDNPDEVQFPD